MNKVGERLVLYRGISFQNLLGISFLLGRLIQQSWGDFETALGCGSTRDVLYSVGEQSYIKTVRDAC